MSTSGRVRVGSLSRPVVIPLRSWRVRLMMRLRDGIDHICMSSSSAMAPESGYPILTRISRTEIWMSRSSSCLDSNLVNSSFMYSTSVMTGHICARCGMRQSIHASLLASFRIGHSHTLVGAPYPTNTAGHGVPTAERLGCRLILSSETSHPSGPGGDRASNTSHAAESFPSVSALRALIRTRVAASRSEHLRISASGPGGHSETNRSSSGHKPHQGD